MLAHLFIVVHHLDEFGSVGGEEVDGAYHDPFAVNAEPILQEQPLKDAVPVDAQFPLVGVGIGQRDAISGTRTHVVLDNGRRHTFVKEQTDFGQIGAGGPILTQFGKTRHATQQVTNLLAVTFGTRGRDGLGILRLVVETGGLHQLVEPPLVGHDGAIRTDQEEREDLRRIRQ